MLFRRRVHQSLTKAVEVLEASEAPRRTELTLADALPGWTRIRRGQIAYVGLVKAGHTRIGFH